MKPKMITNLAGHLQTHVALNYPAYCWLTFLGCDVSRSYPPAWKVWSSTQAYQRPSPCKQFSPETLSEAFKNGTLISVPSAIVTLFKILSSLRKVYGELYMVT
jgi:hypothetical protein